MKTSIFKSIWIFFLTLVFGLLLIYHHFKTDFPLTVTVEMSAEKSDNVQLFYTTFRGFNEPESILQPVNSGAGWEKLRFDLPDYHIKGLRIDPGFKPSKFAIKSIKIESRKEELFFKGEAISDRFDLINLEIATDSNSDSLVFTAANNDPQLVFKGDLREEISQRDASIYHKTVVIAGIIYLLLLLSFILFGKKIRQSFRRTDLYLQNIRYEKLTTDYVMGFLRRHGFIIGSAFFISILAFGYELFNFSLSIDDEAASLMSASEMKSAIVTGRWAFYFLNFFFHPYSVMPYYTTALALFFLASSAALFIIYQQGNLSAKLVFLAIFISSPLHSYYLAFNLSFYYALGMLLATISYLIFVGATKKKTINIGSFAMAATLLGISIALYQSMITYFIVLMVFHFFLAIINVPPDKNQLGKFVVAGLTVIVFGVIFYKTGDYLTRYFFLSAEYRNNTDYLNAFDGWGMHDAGSVLKHLFLSTLRYLLGLIGREEILGIAEKTTLIIAVILTYQLAKKARFTQSLFLNWLALALLIFSPFTLMFLNGLSLPIRAMMPLALMIGMLWFLVYRKAGPFFRRILLLFVVLILINNAYINTRLFFASKTAWEADKAMAHRIAERIYKLNPKIEDGTIRVAFIGDYQPTENHLFLKSEVFGASFFHWDTGLNWRKFLLLKTLGYNEFIEATPQKDDYFDLVDNMPAWPHIGSVALYEDIVVVKLSD